MRRSIEWAGFTLFEVMIAIAIVGLVLGVVVVRVNRSADKNMKAAGNRLAAVVRYLYNRSAIEGLYVKLVLDLDGQTYWVETSTDPMVISRESSETEEKDRDKDKSKDKDKDEGESEGKDEDKDKTKEGEEKLLSPKESFMAEDSHLLKASKLPSVVFFKDVWVEHKKGPAESGEAAIYFFPNGYVEHAMINLRDKDDKTHYSIETEPLSGAVNSETEYRKFEEKQ